jgi:hypothetical protein
MTKKIGSDQNDGAELFHDPDLDLDVFVESAGEFTVSPATRPRRSERDLRREIEELREARLLRAELEGWDDLDELI